METRKDGKRAGGIAVRKLCLDVGKKRKEKECQ
jgi:hypothetical protein